MPSGPATRWATSLACCFALGLAADKPTLPFVYSDEVWTGIEYQVASHLIQEGFVDEGLTIVKALRSRYDGRTRNPWNEYECGNWYARAMSSFALVGAISGFRYSAVDQTLHFGPKLKVHPFVEFLLDCVRLRNSCLRRSHRHSKHDRRRTRYPKASVHRR